MDRHHTEAERKEAGAACGSGILSKHLVLAPFSHNQAIVQFEMMEIAHPYLVLLHCKYTQTKFKTKLIRKKRRRKHCRDGIKLENLEEKNGFYHILLLRATCG